MGDQQLPDATPAEPVQPQEPSIEEEVKDVVVVEEAKGPEEMGFDMPALIMVPTMTPARPLAGFISLPVQLGIDKIPKRTIVEPEELPKLIELTPKEPNQKALNASIDLQKCAPPLLLTDTLPRLFVIVMSMGKSKR